MISSLAKRKRLIAALAVGATAAGTWFNRQADRQSGAAEASPPTQTESRLRVETIHPVKGGMARTTLLPGAAHAFESAEIYAKVSGYLKRQEVDIGARVEQGMLLAEIEVPELAQEIEREKALLRQATAEVGQAEAKIKTMIAERSAAQSLVAQAEANVKRYESDRAFKDKQYRRIQELHALNSIEERLVDEKLDQLNAARAAETTARNGVLAAKQQVLAAAARVTNAESELSVAKSKVDVATAALKKTKVLLEYAKITSPYQGVITARHYHRGAFIRSADHGGEVPLFSVGRVDLMRVVAYVPDRDVPFTQVGDEAHVRFDALPEKDFPAKVSRLSASENAKSRTMRVEIDLPNPDELIKDGMYGRVEIFLEPPAEGLTIPSACLFGNAGREGAQVYVASDGKLRLTKISIGKDNGSEVEVTAGLSPTDAVVLNPTGALADGAVVDAVAYHPPASSH